MSLLAAPPDVIRWSPRSIGHGDCAVAAIEIACGVTYETALAAALSIAPDVLTAGMSWPAIRKSVESLGFKSRMKRKYDLEEDTGILAVQQPNYKDSDHAVYLWEGRIIEPKHDRQQLWLEASAFLNHYKYESYGLLTVTFKED